MNKIFETAHIGSMKLNNRVIRSATHEGLGDNEGRPRDELTETYLRLARGGAGAIITGFMAIQKNGKALQNMRMFDDDRYIDDYKKVTRAVKGTGVPLIAQLAHAGGQTHPDINGSDVVAPSGALYQLLNVRARELDDGEIREIVDNFTAAIRRAKDAGFDGVQIHAGHGYLLGEFLSPLTNRRTDGWGGSTERRFRVLHEIIDGARAYVNDFPILAKMSAYDYDHGGMTVEESMRMAELFQKQGLDALEVSCGGVTDGFNCLRVSDIPIDALLNLHPMIASLPAYKKILMKLMKKKLFKMYQPLLNYNVDAASCIKKSVDMPVIVVGGIRKLSDIESVIGENQADFVAMSRPFIAEPDLVNKFRSGNQAESKCINCGYCLLGVVGRPLACYRGKLPKDVKKRLISGRRELQTAGASIV